MWICLIEINECIIETSNRVIKLAVKVNVYITIAMTSEHRV